MLWSVVCSAKIKTIKKLRRFLTTKRCYKNQDMKSVTRYQLEQKKIGFREIVIIKFMEQRLVSNICAFTYSITLNREKFRISVCSIYFMIQVYLKYGRCIKVSNIEIFICRQIRKYFYRIYLKSFCNKVIYFNIDFIFCFKRMQSDVFSMDKPNPLDFSKNYYVHGYYRCIKRFRRLFSKK